MELPIVHAEQNEAVPDLVEQETIKNSEPGPDEHSGDAIPYHFRRNRKPPEYFGH